MIKVKEKEYPKRSVDASYWSKGTLVESAAGRYYLVVHNEQGFRRYMNVETAELHSANFHLKAKKTSENMDLIVDWQKPGE